MLNMKNIIAAGAKEDVGFFGLGLVFRQIVIHWGAQTERTKWLELVKSAHFPFTSFIITGLGVKANIVLKTAEIGRTPG